MSAESSNSPSGGPVGNRVPLTDAQRDVWFASQMSDGASLAYNETLTLRLVGNLNVGALRRALRLLLARQEALRTRIEASGAAQWIMPSGTIELTIDQVDAATSAEREQQAQAWVQEKARRPFNLVDGPLFCPALLRIDAQTHFLTLVVHHVICDGWSLGVITRELGALYAAELVGRAAKLPEAPALSAYIAQQPAEKSSGEFAAAQEFWLKEFAGEVPVIELPTDRPRNTHRTFAGALLTRQLPADIGEGIKALCTRRECTAFTALFAAFSVLLHRMTGGEELVIGVPSAGQVMAGFGTLVGHFANLLPIRSSAPASQTFTEFLDRVRQNLTNAMEHWRYPFGSLLAHLHLARDASRAPLTPVVFNTTGKHAAFDFGGLMAEVQAAPKEFVNFDLNFHFGINGERVTVGCYYSTELFDAATIERWLQHFETLLRGIVTNPDAKLGELPLLSDAERHRILREWNDTASDYRREATVHQLFEEQVQRSPDATALVAGSERLSYLALDRRANVLAAEIQRQGVGADAPVGIFLERSLHLPVAMLGVLKAGGAYVPLDPSHPADRLAFKVTDTGMRTIVTQRKLAELLPKTGVKLILMDDLADGAAADVTASNGASARNLAYIIYTSGSTGQPKGVCLEHRGVMALVAWARRQYRAEELDGVLFATNATFDVSVFESLVPLCLGGKVIIAENILELVALPASNEVKLVSGVPSAVAELVRANHLPASVITVNVAGEPCPQSLVDKLYARRHVERVIDVYGPTETTVYSTGSVRRAGGTATIGRPLPNERAYILDAQLQPVPIGVRGELFIGGAKLARGYLNRPELTREKFITSPFDPTERLYRTGDRACFMPDGTIEYHGRLDHQVKIRGHRIELGEIETALLEHPAVNDAVVVTRTDAVGGLRLVGYVACAPDAGGEEVELRDFLRRRLPDYMAPGRIVVLADLPRTTSGKVNRRALPEPAELAAATQPVAPRTTTEEILAELWCDVLGVKAPGVHDNFFEIGGHSLLAAQVIARVHDQFGVELTLRHFFSNPTIAALASETERVMIDEIQAAGATHTPAGQPLCVTAKERP